MQALFFFKCLASSAEEIKSGVNTPRLYIFIYFFEGGWSALFDDNLIMATRTPINIIIKLTLEVHSSSFTSLVISSLS